MSSISNSLLEQLKEGTSSVLKISLKEFEYERDDLAQVEAAARGNPHITTLELDCTGMTSEMNRRSAPLLKVLYASLHSATTLKLIAAHGFLTSGHLQGSEHFTSISVSLNGQRASTYRFHLGRALRHHTGLRSLYFTSPRRRTVIEDLNRLPSSLVDINLDSEILSTNFDFLVNPALSSLSIARLDLASAVEWRALVRGLERSRLQHLKVFMSSTDEDGMVAVLDTIENMTTLESLDLHVARPRGRPPPIVLYKLIWPSCRLKELRVCATSPFEPAITNEEIVDFAARLTSSYCCLNRLHLKGVICPDLACALLGELKRVPPTSLRHLSITTVDGPESDGTLERAASLVEDIFALSFTSITLELGQSAPKITVSSLRGQTLVKKLKQNYTLESLDLDLVDSDCLSRLQSICRLNAAGRSYLKTGNVASRKCGVDVLTKVKEELDDLFTHLVENPSLCSCVYDDKSVDAAPTHASKKLRTEE